MSVPRFYGLSEPMGESALILRQLTVDPSVVAIMLNDRKPQGLHTAVASYDTVGLYFDPTQFDLAELDNFDLPFADEGHSRTHVIPVCYQLGEDFDLVCKTLKLSETELISAHCSTAYKCFAVGFCPGFPYLGWLPEVLQGVRRLDSPRVRITPGSVGITGKQTGIYPLVRPGGWPLIGRTPLTIVDPDSNYFPIQSGDQVQFEPISRAQFEKMEGSRL